MNSRRLMCSPLTRVSPRTTPLKEKPPCAPQQICSHDVADGSFASIHDGPVYVRLSPDSDRTADILERQLRAKSCREQVQQIAFATYSITSSAQASTVEGMSRPSVLAV